MESRDYREQSLDWPYVMDYGPARCVIYKAGALVEFETASGNVPPGGRRNEILDQSTISRKEAAFAFGNAECDWLAMIVLTWRTAPHPDAVKKALRHVRRAWRKRWGESCDAWMMEMQSRGVPHYHVFVGSQSAFGRACANAERHTIPAGERWCEAGCCIRTDAQRFDLGIVRGGPDYWLRSTWHDAIRDHSEESKRFNAAGIIEIFRSPDAAGRYVAKEAAKRAQKVLPEQYRDGLGRWWWLNPLWTPQPRYEGTVDLKFWPWHFPVTHVWKAQDLAACISEMTPCARVLDMDTMEAKFVTHGSDR